MVGHLDPGCWFVPRWSGVEVVRVVTTRVEMPGKLEVLWPVAICLP